MSISPPVQISVPFGTGGLKNTIPASADPVTGNAGYSGGFPAINMTPKVAGGIPPFGEDFNGIFFDVTTAIQFLEAGGSFPYSSTFSTAVGGYPIGALVSRTDSGGLWRNTVANNTTDPEAFGAGWQPEDAGSAAIAMTNANVTLTALQSARSIITITGVLTANLNLIFPGYIKQWLVANNCTGAFSVTAKTAAGSGVAIPVGATQAVYGNGTDIGTAGRGGLIGLQVFNASGTYTPTQGTGSVIVELCGGGGGSGGTATAGAGQASGSASGSGGGYAKRRITSGFSGVTVTVGAAGTAGAAGTNAGGNGGASSFGALLSATGGLGGAGGVAFGAFPASAGSAGGGSGSLGDINAQGGAGTVTLLLAATSGGQFTGVGGGSYFGGGSYQPGDTAPIAAVSPGSGGGAVSRSQNLSSLIGAAGAKGIVIIWEYSQ